MTLYTWDIPDFFTSQTVLFRIFGFKATSTTGVRTAGGLARKTQEDLLAVDGLGEKGISEIKKALEDLGLELKA